jgi:hypothetical protein
MTAFR